MASAIPVAPPIGIVESTLSARTTGASLVLLSPTEPCAPLIPTASLAGAVVANAAAASLSVDDARPMMSAYLVSATILTAGAHGACAQWHAPPSTPWAAPPTGTVLAAPLVGASPAVFLITARCTVHIVSQIKMSQTTLP